MKLSSQIVTVNIVLAILFAILFSAMDMLPFILMLGAVFLVGAIVDFFVWLIIYAVNGKSTEWSRGFMLSSGIFALLGFCICGSALALM